MINKTDREWFEFCRPFVYLNGSHEMPDYAAICRAVVALAMPAREYYHRNYACPAAEVTDSDCICWHKTSTGPFPSIVEGGKRGKFEPYIWRDAPVPK